MTESLQWCRVAICQNEGLNDLKRGYKRTKLRIIEIIWVSIMNVMEPESCGYEERKLLEQEMEWNQ